MGTQKDRPVAGQRHPRRAGPEPETGDVVLHGACEAGRRGPGRVRNVPDGEGQVKKTAEPVRLWVVLNWFGSPYIALNYPVPAKAIADTKNRRKEPGEPFRVVEFVEVVKPKRKVKP